MKVLVASVETELYRGFALSVVTETADGELKIFPGHAPLLAVLRPGLLRIYCPADHKYPKGRQDMMLISGGYLEVQPGSVTVLADAFERIGDIDAAKAKRIVDQARETFRLAAPTEADKALLELEMAIARLRLARKYPTHG
ncbi:MAG: ATP synthase F1 subunit epsilon [Zetaproteobacteria bacterium CG12_big_fil_rev_8_21_14_0_65_55_1124]|nr:MAG: ATP synthase F1 subunit epsilon [Zetaproteobacteria bacterium CG1_02_55_237]PIS20265.1 MAG: ATP synthase F1 subunit epsilon [Zetaproteobacteria bacterium CG08_land_8_20_14_0_20_55_17]PIW43142.1 MAG: ATP synthase F1 subunit epsilon [Zetaproteobacteria bacterium CG12_big_fil_rev_8_21_14_0_65_55_1124]PIY52106.1 MAG: ATP synthase F1 subunit epsilon [Zetaproteobacteria bacterium CG_4_10_14_0_8_um_filter_55_43]PIZ38118.1 MAG: ATP synthase F1 subunit epsilon [Zetaproteobacteria bacterium CG_4_